MTDASGFIQEYASVGIESASGFLSVLTLPILVQGDTRPGQGQPIMPSATSLPWEKGVSPGPDWVWKGNPDDPDAMEGKGNWVNDKTGQKLHPDFDHPEPKRPHWGLQQPDGTKWDIFPDGTVLFNG